MSLRALALTSLSALALGCSEAKPVGQVSGESPAQLAARVFAVAEGLEKELKTKQAFAAYHEVAQQFPNTPEGKKAAGRIQRAQRQAVTKTRRRAPTGGARQGAR